jgi:hypothetical protein
MAKITEAKDPWQVVDGSVIVWTPNGGKMFTNIIQADKYYSKMLVNFGDVAWQRVMNPLVHGKVK